MRKLALAILLAAFPTPLLPAADRPQIPPKLTLQQALAIAYQQSPALRQARARLLESEGLRDETRSAGLPQVSVAMFEARRTANLKAQGIDIPSIPGSGFQVPERVGPFSQVDARAFVNQELIDIPLLYRRRASVAKVDASQADSQNARELLAANVATAYFQAQRDQAQTATLREQMALARQLYTITADRQQQGVASLLDSRRAEQQVNNVQQELLEAESALTASKLQLANIIYAQITDAYELADIENFYQAPAISAQEAVDQALHSRPDYQAAQAQLRAAEMESHSVGTQRYPTLSLAADYGQSGQRPFHNLNTYRVQGTLSVPVFLGGRIAAQEKEAEGRVDQARAALDAVQSQIETEVRTALQAVNSAQRQVQVAEDTVRLANDEVDLSTARFTRGISDNTEVVNAQDHLARAEDNRIRALFNYNLARANLYRAIGAAEKTYQP
jgi:outer membrane protein